MWHDLRRFLPLAAFSMLAACSDAPRHAVYTHDQCHRLDLVDKDRGYSVVGAEDMVKLPNGDLLVTAYDRRSTRTDGTPPEGGIYRVPFTALKERTARVSSLFDVMPHGLRPHGIDAVKRDDGSIQVAVVNRGYITQDGNARPFPSIMTFILNGSEAGKPVFYEDKRYCRANDLFLTEGKSDGFTVTLDRQYCSGWMSLWENITGSHQGNIRSHPQDYLRMDENYHDSFDNLAFPNGIGIQFKDRPLGDNNFLVFAETRANRLHYFPKTDRRDIVTLPGSPDNLTVGKPGLILAAVHPSLFKLALYRYRWPLSNHAPSRVVKVTGDQVLVLFDDPAGETFSAASVAVQTAGRLVLGSVGDKGLLVCNPREIS